ncbi:hypothetical protein PG994_014433 [Apiospora phragmitis]|uniref:Uncharacterized protein n=1 Tax=Apiospora phragmitis TaxID=2905665 RepID=A0ABR1T4A7_9PEZI
MPGDDGEISYESFVGFIGQFAHARVPDSAVAPRYAYGELSSLWYHQYDEDEEDEVDREYVQYDQDPQEDDGGNEVSEQGNKLSHAPVGRAIALSVLLGPVIVIWGWEGVPWAVQLLILGPLGVVFVDSVLGVLIVIYDWVFGEIKPKGTEAEEKLLLLEPADVYNDDSSSNNNKEKASVWPMAKDGSDMV